MRRGGLVLWSIAVLGTLGFLFVVALQHALVPRLSPTTHMVSEYANASAGWLMVAGFLAWTAGLGATAALCRRAGQGTLAALLAVACIGCAVTAVFATQTVAGQLPAGVQYGWRGRLHDLGSGVLALALLAAAAWSAWSLRTAPRFRAWALAIVALAIAVDAALLALGTLAGVRQRLLLLAACTWQLALIGRGLPNRGR